MKTFIALAAMTLFANAHASATAAPRDIPLQTQFNGPALRLIVCPQAEFAPGSTVECSVLLKSKTALAHAELETSLWRGSEKIQSANQLINLKADTALEIKLPITLPQNEMRGYLITARLKQDGADIDHASGFIEAADSYLRYPRPATIGHPVKTIDAENQLASWLAYGVNLPIYFDIYYKAHTPAPPRNSSSWTNLEGMTVQRSTVMKFVKESHARNMGIYMLQDWFAANDDWSTDGSGMDPEWALFRKPCRTPAHPAPCTIYDGKTTQAEQIAQGENWRAYGWTTNNLPVFDPTNKKYIDYFIDHVQELYTQFNLDGLWIDTLGDLGSRVYRADGSQLNDGLGLGPTLTPFTNAVLEGTSKPAFINNVGFWAGEDVARNCKEPFIYSEIWSSERPNGPNDTPFYTDINAIMHKYRAITNKPVILPAYVNDLKRDSSACAGPDLTTPCEANEPTARYLTSQILASGAYHMMFEENDTIDAGPYFVQQQLHMAPSLIAAQLSLQHFGIAYEDILRDSMIDAKEMCSISGGTNKDGRLLHGDYLGQPGHIYTLPKSKPGVNVCHLLNRTNLNNNHWKDEHGLYPSAPLFQNFQAVIHYQAGKAVKKVWYASPDADHGEPHVIDTKDFTLGSDSQGSYVKFNVPALEYWDMLVVETAP